jgi:AraC-like DNA-binding protein
MIFKTYRPKGPLARCVEFFWFYDGLFPAHSMERVLPQGAFELVIDLRDVPRKLFTNSELTEWRDYRGAWLSGAQSKFIVIDVLPASSMIGVHFRPGGAAPFLDFPATELTDRVEEIDRIWGRSGFELREQLLDAETPAVKFAILEQFLLQRLQTNLSENRAIDFLLDRFVAQPSTASISKAARALGESHKHLIEGFCKRVGLPPKRFCRIQRFQQALREIETRAALNWSDLAVDAGYYDQAHFINDFQAFSGQNPSRYLMDRGEYLNYVPVREG